MASKGIKKGTKTYSKKGLLKYLGSYLYSNNKNLVNYSKQIKNNDEIIAIEHLKLYFNYNLLNLAKIDKISTYNEYLSNKIAEIKKNNEEIKSIIGLLNPDFRKLTDTQTVSI